MPVIELALCGLTTALFGPSPLSYTNAQTPKKTSSSTYDSINTIVIAGNVFLAHRQSLGAFFDSIGNDASKHAKTEAIAYSSFDDDVERMLSHGCDPPSGLEHAALEGKTIWTSNEIVQRQAAGGQAARIYQRLRPTLVKCELDIKLAGTCTCGSIRRNASMMALASGRVRDLRLLMGAAEGKLPKKSGATQE